MRGGAGTVSPLVDVRAAVVKDSMCVLGGGRAP